MKYQVILKNGTNGIKLFKNVKEVLQVYSSNEIEKLVPIQEANFESADGRNVSSGKKFLMRKQKNHSTRRNFR